MNGNYVRQVTGTGANIDLFCGFAPAKVEAINIDAATGDRMEAYVGMADGSAFKVAGGTRSKITTGGISQLNDASNGRGFRVGADANVNIAGQRLVVIAHRGEQGNQEPSYA